VTLTGSGVTPGVHQYKRTGWRVVFSVESSTSNCHYHNMYQQAPR